LKTLFNFRSLDKSDEEDFGHDKGKTPILITKHKVAIASYFQPPRRY
jgi:hypothetical protein